MTSKEQALRKIISLIEEFDITIEEISTKQKIDTSRNKDSGWLTHLLGYLGSAFIFGGLGLLISMIWGDISSPARVIITYGSGLVALILGIFCVKDERYKKASTPLFLKSAVLLPLGMFVFLGEYGHGNDIQLASIVIFSIISIQFFMIFWKLKRTSLLFFGYLFWNTAIGTVMDRIDIPEETIGVILGFSIMVTAYYIDKTAYHEISPFYYFIGSIGFLWSVFDLVEEKPLIDVMFLPLTIFIMLISVKMKSRALLIVSTFSLLGFLGYYTNEYFADITGWPIALIIMGFALIGISAQAIKLGQKIKNHGASI